jgi:hypothetical protein
VNLVERYRNTPELEDLRREIGKMLLSEKVVDENRVWPEKPASRKQ